MATALEFAQKAGELFTLPDIVIRLQDLIESDNATVDDISEVVMLDPALTAKILKLANSPLYNFSAQIDTVSRAISVIGMAELFNLALATSAVSSVSENVKGVDIDYFWQVGVHCGLIGRELASACKVRKKEKLFVAGLLHDIGQLVALDNNAELTQQVLEHASGEIPWKKQQEVFGFSWAECGAELLKLWKLPEDLWVPVAEQHALATKGNKEQDLFSAIIHIASRAANQTLMATLPEEKQFDYTATIADNAWQTTGLQEEQLAEAVGFAQMEAINVISIICPASAAVI
ncbi:HDOD domain-containing protein [Spartinivicinus poritis]|uniref:HDOD domain-containing protein n=1 Tax=Spartinivicinus poritis TaxID=2994640 RepID=A0ABT5UI98_9GAMM|nr:HDOD domain-containing protein [Spartinivicinus sp. A2-2]MDE1465706.1 HDOD domain-containing protein [Spartinivicinus sp. A2-2]